jgi:hypothetical protein
MNFEVMRNIKVAKYDELQKLAQKEDVYENLVSLAFDTENFSLYVYSLFLILSTKSIEFNDNASEIINFALIQYKGAYSSGLLHARRIAALCSNDLYALDFLLFFYRIPENLVTREEAYAISRKILNIDSHHTLALKTKNEIENKWLQNIPEPQQHIPRDEEYPAFVKLIHTGFYEEAKALLNSYSIDEIAKILHTLMERHNSVALYTFAFFMLLDQETVEGHLLAGKLLLLLKGVLGAESGALFHARRMQELEPTSLVSLEFFLSFYDLPDPLISDAEAITCAQHILAIDYAHEGALKVQQKFPR